MKEKPVEVQVRKQNNSEIDFADDLSDSNFPTKIKRTSKSNSNLNLKKSNVEKYLFRIEKINIDLSSKIDTLIDRVSRLEKVIKHTQKVSGQ